MKTWHNFVHLLRKMFIMRVAGDVCEVTGLHVQLRYARYIYCGIYLHVYLIHPIYYLRSTSPTPSLPFYLFWDALTLISSNLPPKPECASIDHWAT